TFLRDLSLAVEIGPLARLNKTCPVKRMIAVLALQHGELRVPKSIFAAQATLEPAVIAAHHLASHIIADRPQAHDQSLCSGKNKSATQAEDALSDFHFADAGVTCGERHQPGAPEIEVRRLKRRQDSVVVSTAIAIGAGEGQSRTQERVFKIEPLRETFRGFGA